MIPKVGLGPARWGMAMPGMFGLGKDGRERVEPLPSTPQKCGTWLGRVGCGKARPGEVRQGSVG